MPGAKLASRNRAAAVGAFAVGLLCAGPSPAQASSARTAPYAAYVPEAANIRIVLPEEIPWTGEPGRQQQYKVVGDTARPGPYVLLLKWWPNQFSRPHLHRKTRYITVVSGTWWMSSSPIYDPGKTYPAPAGSVVVHEANKVHWDGAKDEPAVLMIAGEGPAETIMVDELGHPKPPALARAPPR